MMKLSTDIYDHVHPEESKELIQESIKDLREAIKSPCKFAQSDDFLLLFLRAEVFDVPKALARYQKYWSVRKLLLAPTDRANKEVLFELRQSEQAVIDDGIIQLLPKPHGHLQRAVIVFRPARIIAENYQDNDDLHIAMWYVLHRAILDNEYAQKFGIVVLDDFSGYRMIHFDRSSFRRQASVLQGVLPIRVACIHICHPPMIIRSMLPIVSLFLHEKVKKRIKFHSNPGRDLIQTYQFTKEALPKDILGNGESSF